MKTRIIVVAWLFFGAFACENTLQAWVSVTQEKEHLPPGKAATPQASEAPKQDPKPEALFELTEWHFKRSVAANIKRLSENLGRLDRTTYQRFLKELKKTAEAYTGLNISIQEMIEKCASSEKPEQQREMLHKLREAAHGLDAPKRLCIAAKTSRVDNRGVLVAGLLDTKNREGKPDLQPIILNEGGIYILSPQFVTAWPGRADSALTILDPTEGPWKVLKAATFSKRVRTFDRPWTREKSIGVMEFLAARKQNDEHFLLVDAQDAPLGWISRSDCAFYPADWAEYMETSKDFFTKGLAAMLHGAYYSFDDPCEDERNDLCDNGVAIFDFVSMVTGEILQGGVGSPKLGPVRNETIRLTRIRDASIKKHWRTATFGGLQIDIADNNDPNRMGSYDGLSFRKSSIQMGSSDPPGGPAEVDGTKIPIEELGDLRP